MARRVFGLFNLQIFGCPAYSLVDTQKRNKPSPSVRSLSSSGSSKESSISDFGVSRQGASLPAEMWLLMKNQYCKKGQIRKIKRKVDLQTVQQTLRKRELISQRTLKVLWVK